MKLLLPIFHSLPIQTGFGLRNPKLLRSLRGEISVSVKIWKDFQLVAESSVGFENKQALRIFLSDLFSTEQLALASLATVEFDTERLSAEDRAHLKTQAFEAQSLLRHAQTKLWTAVLFDLIPDKKAGHQYAPILHCAHSGHVSPLHETYALLLNFRPPSLAVSQKNQKLHLQLKNPQGQLLKEEILSIDFNSTSLVSFREKFASVGGFVPGSTINFKGGESQFAIFTLFMNSQSGAFGIEHSLAPFYYCSGLQIPNSRKTFYQNAFSDMKESI